MDDTILKDSGFLPILESALQTELAKPDDLQLKIEATGKANTNLLFASLMLGMLEMVEKGLLPNDGAAMLCYLPLMRRLEESSFLHTICNTAEELTTYPPPERETIIRKIRSMCYELVQNYSRTDAMDRGEEISYSVGSTERDTIRFDYRLLPIERAYELRERFIDTYVNTTNPYYEKYIRDITADTVYRDGMVVSHLWSALKEEIRCIADYDAVMRKLYELPTETVYIMRDIEPKMPEDWPYRSYAPKSDAFLHSDDIIAVSPKKFCQLFLLDRAMEEHHIGTDRFFHEDLYVFDYRFDWYIAFTHEERSDMDSRPLCYSSGLLDEDASR